MSSFTLHLRDHPLKKQKIQTQQALNKIKHRSYIKDLLVSNILKKYADRVTINSENISQQYISNIVQREMDSLVD